MDVEGQTGDNLTDRVSRYLEAGATLRNDADGNSKLDATDSTYSAIFKYRVHALNGPNLNGQAGSFYIKDDYREFKSHHRFCLKKNSISPLALTQLL